ncbi:MAG: methylenetetrahydrofolate--tRNA-(uracil(54)-C(5))-methyltransferase (FADH(2)-oxidizing) TrmFO, partial [Deltaproteobacteria bacterium]
MITIIGAGLAGSEAALQLAARGHRVRLLEQKPLRRTPAQTSDAFCELVCSNSFRGAALSNAVGLLKQEMRWLGSFVMKAADATRVPAGGALAVDRDAFSETMTRWVRESSAIEVVPGTVERLPPERPLLVATGPLTGDSLAQDIARAVGSDQLAYYDAIAPIISSDSIDWSKVFMASRWDKGESEEEQRAYVNCPLDRDGYEAFVDALLAGQKVEPKSFEDVRYFEGCLPIE